MAKYLFQFYKSAIIIYNTDKKAATFEAAFFAVGGGSEHPEGS